MDTTDTIEIPTPIKLGQNKPIGQLTFEEKWAVLRWHTTPNLLGELPSANETAKAFDWVMSRVYSLVNYATNQRIPGISLRMHMVDDPKRPGARKPVYTLTRRHNDHLPAAKPATSPAATLAEALNLRPLPPPTVPADARVAHADPTPPAPQIVPQIVHMPPGSTPAELAAAREAAFIPPASPLIHIKPEDRAELLPAFGKALTSESGAIAAEQASLAGVAQTAAILGVTMPEPVPLPEVKEAVQEPEWVALVLELTRVRGEVARLREREAEILARLSTDEQFAIVRDVVMELETTPNE